MTMQKIKNARLFTGEGFVPGTLVFDAGIRALVPQRDADGEGDDAGGAFLVPGLIDIHTHGALGLDAWEAGREGLRQLGAWYASRGVTSWCPTAPALPGEALFRAVSSFRAYERGPGMARLLGIHLEGPFLSPERPGSQNPAALSLPDPALIESLQEASGGLVRLVTLAPELPGAMEAIGRISRLCRVSLGHTGASYETALSAFEAGATQLTHLFNVMEGLRHRAPGPIAAGLEAGAFAELIPDGFHVHPAMVRLAFRLFEDRIVLISDSLSCTGMPDGTYALGGLPVTLEGGRALLPGTKTLAGSSISLLEGVRRAVSFGIPLERAVYAATAAPAAALGLAGRIGTLSPGAPADFILLSRDLELMAVYAGGRKI